MLLSLPKVGPQLPENPLYSVRCSVCTRALLSQASVRRRRRSARDHYGQDAKLSCGQEADPARGRTQAELYRNNRCENSHQPTRTRKRQMKRFQSPEQAQRFLSTFESINTTFSFRRHLLSAACYRRRLTHALQLWRAIALGVALPRTSALARSRLHIALLS